MLFYYELTRNDKIFPKSHTAQHIPLYRAVMRVTFLAL